MTSNQPGGNMPSSTTGTRSVSGREKAAMRRKRFTAWIASAGKAPQGRPFFLLRRRMIFTNLAVAAAVLAVLSAALYFYEAAAAREQVDHVVASEAIHEATSAKIENGKPASPSGTEQPEAPYEPSSPNLFSVVLATPRTVVQDDDSVAQYGLPDWRAANQVLSGRAPSVYSALQWRGHSLRLYTTPIRANGHIVGAVQSGTSLDQLNRQLQELQNVLILLGLGVLLLTAVSSLMLTERALAPARAAYVRQRQFAAGASHELRTPLAFVRSQAELIVGQLRSRAKGPTGEPSSSGEAPAPDACTDDAQMMDDAQEIIGEVDYMARLVRDLLLLARDEHDHAPEAWTQVDLSTLVREAAARVRPTAVAQGLTVTDEVTHAGDEAVPLLVRGEPDRLRQLLLILLDNAVKYTPSGGSVRVRAETAHRWLNLPTGHGSQALITVSDTGVGIAPEHVAHIFEPFYRVTAAPGQAHGLGSTGLGLALAEWIVQAHDGAIGVQSTPGSGTTFTVHLPLA